jgi:WD40 repeat protein
MQSAAHSVFPLTAPLNGLAWHENTLAAIGGDGTLHLLRPEMDAPRSLTLAPHSALLGLITTPQGFVTAADSGDLHLTTPQGETTLLAGTGHMFLEHMAYCPRTQQVFAATGKKLTAVKLKDGTTTILPHILPSTIAGLAVSPIGARIAASHYGGATILATDSPKNAPRSLTWKGSHLALTYSPDGKWLISAMQENAIHLWRLSDGMDLQMRGYPAKINQFSWDVSGLNLATNGGFGVPLWNFSNKEKGPAGQQARVIADSGAQETTVSAVAMHPKGPFCAVGYADGLALLTNTDQDRAVLIQEPASTPLTHLAWSPDGLTLATTTASGTLTLVNFTKLA